MRFPFFKQSNESSNITDTYVPSIREEPDIESFISEKFRGEVKNDNIVFPTELGVEHPFDFKITEGLYKKFSFFSAVIDKYVDFVVGPGFFIEAKDERVKEIIEQFMRDVNFDNILRGWTKEALIKGNGFLELGGDKNDGIEGLKLLNANQMYVVRDKFGVIEGYNQFIGDIKKTSGINKENTIPFKPNQIAHVAFNVVGDDAYGIGIGYSAINTMNNLLTQEKSMHTIMHRKANSPLHAKLGRVDGQHKIIPKKTDVDNFGKQMEILHNKTDWATDALVELKVVDFGNIGDKFDKVLEYDINMLIYSFQVPGVLLGLANIPEGLAGVQMEAFQRRIQSIQAELEKIIENKIFSRVLEANGFAPDTEVEFEWGTPNVLEVEGRMTLISEMIKSPIVNPALKSMLEDEMINLLKFDTSEWEKLKLEQQNKEEEERRRLEAQPQPVVPGQNRSFPQRVEPKREQPRQPKPEEIVEPILKELSENRKDIENKLEKIDEAIKSKMKEQANKDELERTKTKLELDAKLNELKPKEQLPIIVKIEDSQDKTYGNENSKLKSTIDEMSIQIKGLRDKIGIVEAKLENTKDDKIDKIDDSDIRLLLKELKDEMKSIKQEKKNLEKKIDDIKKKSEVKPKVKKVRRKIFKSKKKGLLNKSNKTKEESFDVSEVVRKVGNEWCVMSERTGKSLGCFPSKAQAVKRLGQIKGFSKQSYEYDKSCPHCEEGMDDMNDISEWLGFSYSKYLNEILIALEAHDFEQIKAVNEIQLEAGFLTDKQVVELRAIMNTGFKKGQSINEMVRAVDKKVGLKDLLRLDENGDIKIGASGLPILSKRSGNRAVAIIRSEITRIANQGAVNHYKEGGIQQVMWVASFGDRTCPICEALDNQIFEINNHPAIPQHPMCRCTLNAVTELR